METFKANFNSLMLLTGIGYKTMYDFWWKVYTGEEDPSKLDDTDIQLYVKDKLGPIYMEIIKVQPAQYDKIEKTCVINISIHYNNLPKNHIYDISLLQTDKERSNFKTFVIARFGHMNSLLLNTIEIICDAIINHGQKDFYRNGNIHVNVLDFKDFVRITSKYEHTFNYLPNTPQHLLQVLKDYGLTFQNVLFERNTVTLNK